MELFVENSEYGLTVYHVGANGAYYIYYSSEIFENSDEILADLERRNELFVPAPNFWGDAFKEEFVATAKNFPEAAELVLYHRANDEEDLEGLAWGLLKAMPENRKEFYKTYLHGYGVENVYEFVSNAPAKLIHILANIAKKL